MGWDNSTLKGSLGAFLIFNCGIQPVEKLTNGLKGNDIARQQIVSHDVQEDNTFILDSKGKIKIELNSGGFLAVKPFEHEKWLAYSRVKFGWRNFSATPEKAVVRIAKYFDKMLAIVTEQKALGNVQVDID